MSTFIILCKKMNEHIFFKISSFRDLLSSLVHKILILHLNPVYLELIYFITISSIGFVALKSTKSRTAPNKPNDINLFFMSVSATTVSSMSTVEMEVFSDTQLVFLTLLMFLGGEVFTSMVGLHLKWAKKEKTIASSDSYDVNTHIELGTIRVDEKPDLKLKSIKVLAYMVLCYLLVAHTMGSALVAVYLSLVPSAKRVLETKGIKLLTFSVFTTVATFSNCGFMPTNENMVIFRSNPGLLLILIPQILMGNTLYPVFLRLSIWVRTKMTRTAELRYLLENTREVRYGGHLLPGLDTVCLLMTALGLIAVQMVLFCSLEWSSGGFGGGLSLYEKVVGIVFQVVNSRHSGESVFDLSAFSPAILIMFVLMMYLPPYTSYLPIEQAEKDAKSTEKKNTNKGFWELILFSELAYLFLFIFLICITERPKMKTDPLNFNVLSIVVEVVSAYRNVGFSVGYSCERRINPDGDCKDAWFGLVGRWSDEGKFLLVIVMIVGRLRKFNKRGGKAWSLA